MNGEGNPPELTIVVTGRPESPEPSGDADWGEIGMAAIQVGAGFIPGVGEAMDVYTLFAPDSTLLDRGLSVVSLGVNFLTAGFAPNFGGVLKAGRKIEQTTAQTGKAGSKIEEAAEQAANHSSKGTTPHETAAGGSSGGGGGKKGNGDEGSGGGDEGGQGGGNGGQGGDDPKKGMRITRKKVINRAEKIITNAKKGKVRRGKDYHGRLGEQRENEILTSPDAVYEADNGNFIFHKNGDIVVTYGSGSAQGNLITSYGQSGPRGQSGAAVYGGNPSDPGVAITPDMITQGKIPRPGGGFIPPATQIF